MEPKMTSAISARRPTDTQARAFTMVEMMVVVVVMVVLATILLSAVARANRIARRTSAAAELQSISVALSAYRDDMGDFPRVINEDLNGNGILDAGEDRDGNGQLDVAQGSQVLCRALIASGPEAPLNNASATTCGYDGADGPGFRRRAADPGADNNWATTADNVRASGRVYGPYLAPDKFKVSATDASAEIVDLYGGPILYYPAADPSPNIRLSAGFVADFANSSLQQALFDARHNSAVRVSATVLRRKLGDQNANGVIDGGEVPAATGACVLWSAGADGIFGSTDDVTNIADR
jgi:prepilin-type N-terminal cleavage/methylation domain-containing protein